MKEILDWYSPDVVNIYNEVGLWSAPFTRLMLENIPMRSGMNVLDIGFGTGVPLIELAQRFGNNSTIYGVDVWEEAINRTREKIRILELKNIEIHESSAEILNFEDDSLDLICSNLGVNNFSNKEQVLQECHRVLSQEGSLCISTNPTGTFEELFDIFLQIMTEENWDEEKAAFAVYLQHRSTLTSITNDFLAQGFQLDKVVKDETNMRFLSGESVLDHFLIRIGFLRYWKELIPEEKHDKFFGTLVKKIDQQVAQEGEFSMKIPMLYLSFSKQ